MRTAREETPLTGVGTRVASMRIAELSARTGVSVPSIKFYLREGLLLPGRRTGPNQARYSDEHVRRLDLVRTLIGQLGMSVVEARDVLGGVGVRRSPVDDLVARLDDLGRHDLVERLGEYAGLAEGLARLDHELGVGSGIDGALIAVLLDALVAAVRARARDHHAVPRPNPDRLGARSRRGVA